jgi:glycosyltransferase involved in cell wall biosynthesis
MRILYINYNLLRSDSEAGVWARELVRELRAVGAEVDTAPDLGGAKATTHSREMLANLKTTIKRRASQYLTLKLVEYYLQVTGVTRTLRMCWKLWQKRNEFDCSVLLVRTYEYDWTPVIAAKLLRRPLVLEVHTPFHLERELRGRRPSKLLRRLERLQWRAADRIWVNSHELETIIAEDIGISDRITCIPHGIRMEQFGRDPRQHANETVRVVFVGSFYHWHGVELLIDAFAMAYEHVKGLRLSLIGDGLTRHACEARVRNLGIAGAVEFTGWISREKVLEHLADAHIGVAPYLKLKTFYFDPVKVIEYMAAGLAVIASRQGSIGRTVDHGKDGLLVPPNDVKALAKAITTLTSDAVLRGHFGEAARQKIARNQSWDVVAGRIVSLCSETMTPNGRFRCGRSPDDPPNDMCSEQDQQA